LLHICSFFVYLCIQKRIHMATITIMLDPLRKNNDDTRSVVLRYSDKRDRKYIRFGKRYRCKKEHWDDELARFRPQVKDYKFLNNVSSDWEKRADDIIKDHEKHDLALTFDSFKSKYKSSLEQSITFFKYTSRLIGEMEKTSLGNSVVYKETLSSFMSFKNGIDLMFPDINLKLLREYQRFLEKSNNSNSISFRMRTLRSIYNRAIADGIAKQEYYPFGKKNEKDKFCVSSIKTSPNQRAISKADIKKIYDIKPSPADPLFHSYNIIVFSYFTRGMNFGDIALLRWDDIYDDRIHYTRSKTKKNFSIGINAESKKILDIYRDKESPFVFPILSDIHVTEEQKRTRIKTAGKKLNKDLRKIAGKVGIEGNITSYVLRHTYASVQMREGESVVKISQAMGHADIKTTETYLKGFEDHEIDEMDNNLL